MKARPYTTAMLLTITMVCSSAVWALQPSTATGRWITPGGTAIVEIAPCGAAVCGRIVRVLKSSPGASPLDVKNPEKKLRSQKIEGLVVLKSFVGNVDMGWQGIFYDHESGISYSSKMLVETNTLSFRNYRGFSLIGFPQTWSRAR